MKTFKTHILLSIIGLALTGCSDKTAQTAQLNTSKNISSNIVGGVLAEETFQTQNGVVGLIGLSTEVKNIRQWNRNGQLGLVVGATYPGEIARVRELAPTLPLLVPGVGAQGGDAAAVVQAAGRAAPLVVNSSRAILYAGSGADFAERARAVALATRQSLA